MRASLRVGLLLPFAGSIGACAAGGTPGVLPKRWSAGVDCAAEAPFQVHQFDPDTYLIRQSKCVNYEAPFLFLFVGRDRALLMDTGAAPEADVYGTVMGVLEGRASSLGVDPVPLIVAHTHSHGDHRSADAQFTSAIGVASVVGTSFAEVIEFWGLAEWPDGSTEFDLGDRILDVFPIPGHHETSIAVYDRRTRLLLTGDSVYPGHLFIPSVDAWPTVRASVDRLAEFAETHPVQWVLGNHIEMGAVPASPYVYGAEVHPDERALQLSPDVLSRLADALRAQGDRPRCEVHSDFVIHPTFECGFDWNGQDMP